MGGPCRFIPISGMTFLTEVVRWAYQPRKLGRSELNAGRYPQRAGFRGMHMNSIYP